MSWSSRRDSECLALVERAISQSRFNRYWLIKYSKQDLRLKMKTQMTCWDTQRRLDCKELTILLLSSVKIISHRRNRREARLTLISSHRRLDWYRSLRNSQRSPSPITNSNNAVVIVLMVSHIINSTNQTQFTTVESIITRVMTGQDAI